MYTIYVNEKPIRLLSVEEGAQLDRADFKNLVVDNPHKRFLLRYIDNLEKGNTGYESINIIASDIVALKELFFDLFEVQVAAGGLVFNEEQALLAIFRRGYWDLPKGKQDEGEIIEQTAVREVAEETGISDITLGRFIQETYHTFRHPKTKKRILKLTHWYEMSSKKQHLTPQLEEDIEKAVWIKPKDLNGKYPIYQNIIDLLAPYIAV